MNNKEIRTYLQHFSEVYADLKGPPLDVAICGGAALSLLNFVDRVTKDVDLVYPKELPPQFEEAAEVTALRFHLNKNWINQGPVELLELGLPDGFLSRCKKLQFVPALTFLIASRIDQAFFKLYACIDRGGYHVDDLIALNPSTVEIISAAKWCMTHDVSEPFKKIMIDFLKKHGYEQASQQLD